jgi:hypothetical protein
MTTPELTALLAKQVMRWTVAPGRYLMENRRWTPAWRFQPMKRLEDAFRLLDAADPEEYSINSRRGGAFTVRVQIGGTAGEASDTSNKARAISHAVALAIGLKPEGCQPPKTGVERQ